MADNSVEVILKEIRDLRWQFDQVSAKMNQAIYNDRQDLIHDSTLETITILNEILARCEGINQKT